MKKRIRLTESDLHRIVKESVKRVLRESRRPLRESNEKYLYHACKRAWDVAEANDYIDPYATSPSEIEDMAYEILQWGFDDVDSLSDEDYDKCVEILKSFLA